jgi:DNA polymerase III delta subunit
MPGHLTPAAVRAQIAAGSIEPLYLITGDDEAEMSAIGTALAESVDEDVRVFNVQRFYGSDAGSTIAAVLDAASTFPLLAPRRVVLLLQAEKALVARKAKSADRDELSADEDAEGEGGGRTGQLALLKAYAGRPPHAHAAVVLIGAGLQRTFDALAKQAAVVVCEASADVIRTLEVEHGVRFDRDAADLLRQMAGADVARLRADVERVLLYAAGRKTITREQVAEVIGRTAAGGGKKLWNEVAGRRTAAALRELGLELAEGAVPFMVLGLLRSVVERTVVARDLPRALDALLRTDLALKTSGGDPRVLLERLVVEVCATGKD